MDDDLFLTEEQLEEREHLALQRTEFLRDLKDVVATPSGFNVFLWLFRRMGIERQSSEDVRDIAVRNFGEWLIDEIGHASPSTCISLIYALRGFKG